MRNGGITRPLILSFAILFLSAGGVAKAQLETAIAIAGGSLLLDKAGAELRDAIDHARSAAASLLGLADEIAKRRLDQIDEIANRTISDLVGKTEEAATRVLDDATKKVTDLEQQILADVKEVIWQFECAGKRLVIGDLGRALGRLGDLIGTNQIRLTPPVRVLETPPWYTGCLWWCDPYLVNIDEPFGETYKKVKALMEGAISVENIHDDTPADNIVGTYEYLASIAKLTSCFYQGTEERYNRQFIFYKNEVRQWNRLVRVKL